MHQHVPGMGEDMAVSKRGAFCHPAQRHILPDVFRQQLRMPRLRHRIRHGGSPPGSLDQIGAQPDSAIPGDIAGLRTSCRFQGQETSISGRLPRPPCPRTDLATHHALHAAEVHSTEKYGRPAYFSAGLFYPTINKGLNLHGSTRSETAISSFLRKAFGKVADTRPLRMIASSAVRQLPTETLK